MDTRDALCFLLMMIIFSHRNMKPVAKRKENTANLAKEMHIKSNKYNIINHTIINCNIITTLYASLFIR